MRRRSGSRAAVISVLLLGIIVFGLVYYTWNTATAIFQPASTSAQTQPIPFEISKGETTAQIADSLQAKGLIRNALAFRIWARIKGLDTRLQAGIYKKLTPAMTISQLIDQLLDAQPDAIRVVIPEGWRLEQIAQQFVNSDLVKFSANDFLRYTKHINQFPDAARYPILKQVPAGQTTMEGLLFPASYEVPVDGTARDVVNLMLKTMSDTIQQYQLEKLAQQHQMNLYTMLTLASIVEREAGVNADRGNIASVYWNRVYKKNAETNGLLQADPTVQYALDTQSPPQLPKKYWAPLPTAGADSAPNSPWNTYRQVGFPPTPICSPGLASMQAAASPPVTGYYYFLSKRDGTSVFAKTLAEFQQDEQQYLS
ncbi:MAG: endolytic transglycosylase MltG [Chloroflexota bacterium]|nr:endolytic transglycosylase MltG [Chloroflexota bacterium]